MIKGGVQECVYELKLAFGSSYTLIIPPTFGLGSPTVIICSLISLCHIAVLLYTLTPNHIVAFKTGLPTNCDCLIF